MQRKLAVLMVDLSKGLDTEAVSQLEQLDFVELLPEVQITGSSLKVTGDVSPDVLVIGLYSSDDSLAKLKWAETIKMEYPNLAIFVSSQDSSQELLMSAMRAGAQEFLSQPVETGHLIAALRKLHLQRLDRGMQGQEKPGRVVSLHSIKGGVGVTTLCVNLGVAMSKLSGKEAAIVDLDIQMGDIANYLDLSPSYSILDACSGDSIDATRLQSCMTHHDSNVFVLAEPRKLVEARVIDASHVSQILQHLKTMYSFVVVDTPHVLDHRTSAAFPASDHIILVAVADISSIRATRKTLNHLRSCGYGEEKVKVLINRVGKKDGIKLSEIQSALDYPVAWTIPNNYRDVIESINTGIPLARRKRLSNVGKSVQQLAAEIQGWATKPGFQFDAKRSSVTQGMG